LLSIKIIFFLSIIINVVCGIGDLIAQYGENYNDSKDKNGIANVDIDLEINWKRFGVIALFGTVIGGPSYHYWFNYLNELPGFV
jgi:hypothetical protein